MSSDEPTWGGWVEAELERIRADGQWRSVRPLDLWGPHGRLGDRDVVSFASNDYLGLTVHPTVIAAAHQALDRWGSGAGSARLIVGDRPIHDELEAELADWKRTDRAVLFPTGFAANLGVLTTFGGAGVTIFSDELNHASIIDGCRLSRSRVEIYRHGDVQHLSEKMAATAGRRIVVSDTVFSMDGDVAPLAQLTALCADHGALLVLDEAHAVLGPEPPPEAGCPIVRVGTLSKTLASLGGFAAGPQSMAELLVNRARSFIFTTGSTPADTAAALAALRVLRGPEGDQIVARLRGHVERLRPGHPSPILPIMVGDEREAVRMADELLGLGLVVPAIRPPTVPRGTSRLRVALSAAHSDDDLAELEAGLRTVGATPELRGG